MQNYAEIFNEELGTIKTFQAELQVRDGEKSKFFKPRSVPYAVKEAFGEELDRLEEKGILGKTVTEPSTNGESIPLPKAEDLFDTLAGGKKFTKLDLSQVSLSPTITRT